MKTVETHVKLGLTEADKLNFQRAAKLSGLTMTAWIRQTCIQKAYADLQPARYDVTDAMREARRAETTGVRNTPNVPLVPTEAEVRAEIEARLRQQPSNGRNRGNANGRCLDCGRAEHDGVCPVDDN